MREMTDLVMPRTCLVCGRELSAQEDHLCMWCAADIPLTYYWERPHNTMADELNALLERTRPAAAPMPYVYAAALMFYHHENPYKLIPRALKYGGDLPAGRFFAAALGRRMAATAHFADVDLVLPVPLHWLRRWTRGYNQAAVIAAELARALGADMRADILTRAHRTSTQTRLDADARLRNVSGVFAVRRLPPSPPRHILLVDDTFTTGATLCACYNALRAAIGPSPRISVATLAVVQD